jgi:hypothetical protein
VASRSLFWQRCSHRHCAVVTRLTVRRVGTRCHLRRYRRLESRLRRIQAGLLRQVKRCTHLYVAAVARLSVLRIKGNLACRCRSSSVVAGWRRRYIGGFLVIGAGAKPNQRSRRKYGKGSFHQFLLLGIRPYCTSHGRALLLQPTSYQKGAAKTKATLLTACFP